MAEDYNSTYAHVAIIDIFAKVGKMFVILWFGKDEDNGVKIQLHKNGQIKDIIRFKDGGYDGESKSWYEDGQIHIHTFYKNEDVYGEYKVWDKDGKLQVHEFYDKHNQAMEHLPKEIKPDYILGGDGKYYAD